MTWALVIFIVVVITDAIGLLLDTYLVYKGLVDISMLARTHKLFALVLIGWQALGAVALAIHIWGLS